MNIKDIILNKPKKSNKNNNSNKINNSNILTQQKQKYGVYGR